MAELLLMPSKLLGTIGNFTKINNI